MRPRRISLIDLLKRTYPQTAEKELFARVLRGEILVDGQALRKPGARVPAGALVSLRRKSLYVSRAGEKLSHAIDQWGIDCEGSVWIDAGSSTGGFTDCLLSRGASLVYAVDVGTNLLDWRLRGDERVRVMEGVNVMHLRPGDLDPAPRRATADLSFRSLRRAAAHLLGLTTEGRGIFLVKPQFEWSSPGPGFRGVVRDSATVLEIVEDLLRGLASEGVRAENALVSPIRGRKGNREILFLLRAGEKRPGDVTTRMLEKLILGSDASTGP